MKIISRSCIDRESVIKVVIYLILEQIRNTRNPLNGNVLISRDDEIALSCIARESKQQNYDVLISRDDKIARSCIARESVIETGAQQKPAHVI